MRKIGAIACLLLCCWAANAEQWLRREMNFERNDTTFRTTYTYNSLSQLVLQTTQIVDFGALENFAYTEQIFEQNRCTSKSSFVWKNGEWQKDNRTIYEYNSDGLLTTRTDYKGFENQWIVANQTLYFYDQNSPLCTEQRHLIFDGERWQPTLQTLFSFENNRPKMVQFNIAENAIWKLYGQLIFAYNDRLSEAIYREMGTDSLENRRKTLYFYTTDGKIKYEKQQIWLSSRWETCCQMEFSENGTQKMELLANWNVQHWENRYKTLDFYTANLLTNRRFFVYQNQMWLHYFSTNIETDVINFERTISTNNEFYGGNPTEKRHDFLPLQTQSGFDFCYASEAVVRYFETDDTKMQQSDFQPNIKIVPNPSPDGFFYVDVENASNFGGEIYNLQGVQIKMSPAQPSRIIDLTDCEQGIYIAKLIIDGKLFVAKLIKTN